MRATVCCATPPRIHLPIVEREETATHGRYLGRDLCLAWINALAAGDPDADIRL